MHIHTLCVFISGYVLKPVSDSNSWQDLLWPSYFFSFSICEESTSHYPQYIYLSAPASPYVTNSLYSRYSGQNLSSDKEQEDIVNCLLWVESKTVMVLPEVHFWERGWVEGRHRKICFLVYSFSFIGDCFTLSAFITYIGKHLCEME